MSEKHDKFRELAQGRTNKALDSILRIGKLSNRQFYEWEDAEVRKIIKALKNAVSDLEGKFNAPKGSKDGGFTL